MSLQGFAILPNVRRGFICLRVARVPPSRLLVCRCVSELDSLLRYLDKLPHVPAKDTP